MAQRCSFLPTRHAWGGRRRMGTAPGRRGSGGMPIGRPVIGRIEGWREEAPDCQIREDTGPREGAVALRFRVLSACGWPRGTVSRIGGSLSSPHSGWGDPFGGRRAGIVRSDVRPTAGCRAPGPAPDGADLHARGAGPTVPRLRGRAARSRRRPTTSSTRSCRAAFAVVGQPDLPASRLARASALRVVMNVEGNFYPNVDYEACFRRRHPRPGLRPRVRAGGRRVRARPGHRPRARDQPRGPGVPRGPGAVRRGGQRRRDPAAPLGHRPRRLRQPRPRACTGCCARSTRRSGPSTRGSRPPRCARPASSRRRSRRCSTHSRRRLRPGHGHRRERAPARRPRARPAARTARASCWSAGRP